MAYVPYWNLFCLVPPRGTLPLAENGTGENRNALCGQAGDGRVTGFDAEFLLNPANVPADGIERDAQTSPDFPDWNVLPQPGGDLEFACRQTTRRKCEFSLSGRR